MKLTFVIALLFISSVSTFCQDTKGIRETEQFLQVEQRMADARIRKDIAFLERSISEEVFYTAPVGYFVDIVARSNKASYMDKVKSNDVILKSIKLDGVEVHQYGNVAVVTGRMLIKGQMKKEEISYQELFTHTFEQRKNQWLLVAAHSSYMGVILERTESYPTAK